MGVDPQCFLVLFGRLSVVVVVGVSRGEVEAQFRRIGPGGNSVPKEGNRVSIIARLCIRFRQGYLHFEREVWPGRMTQTILEIIRSEEHTSELQSLTNLVCRLLLEKKNKINKKKNKKNKT